MTSTLFRDYLDAALAAQLDKNAHQAFLVFLRQLVGFGKPNDHLTDGRISLLSGIRKDRVQDAVGKVVAAGLIDADISDSGWNLYHIPTVFFGENTGSRFFAPTFPSNGETSQRMGGFPIRWEHTDTNPYRDLPNTEQTAPAQPEVVCDVDLKTVTEIKKPQAVSDADFTALLPALRKLPNTTAVDVLALTSAAILNRSISTTVQRFAGGLIKAAVAGTLDTSGIRPTAPLIDEVAAITRRMDDLKREAAGLAEVYRLGGVPIPPNVAEKIAAMSREYQTLKAKNPATAGTVPGMA